MGKKGKKSAANNLNPQRLKSKQNPTTKFQS